MNFPEEKRPIDVTTKEKIYKNLPGKPKPPKKGKGPKVQRHEVPAWDGFARLQAATDRATETLLRAAGRALRHPAMWLLLACLIGGIAYARLRPPTIDGPALPRAGWRASASEGFDPQAALGDNSALGWTASDDPWSQTQWFAVDMRKPQTFHQVVMQSGPDDYPRDYAVYVSGDGKRWGEAVATGQGTGKTTIADVPKTTARYVKIVNVRQNKNTDEDWTINDFTLH